MTDIWLASTNVVINLLVVFLPMLAVGFAVVVWLSYRRTKWQYERVNGKLFEIITPPEVRKSPQAIELILGGFFDKSYGSKLQMLIDGRVPIHFSLEIVSLAGEIKFFMWIPEKFEKVAKSGFYAQYPQVEIVEVEDYAQPILERRNKYQMWGGGFQTSQSDDNSLPTYKEYKLEDNPDVENTIDPFSSLLEYMGTLGYGEMCWIQLILRGDHALTWKKAAAPPWKNSDTLKDRIEKKIDKIKEGARVNPLSGDTEEKSGLYNFEPGKADDIKDLRSRQGKFHFNAVMRAAYIADKEHFDGFNIPSMIKSLQQFGKAGANTIGPRWETDFDDPVKDMARVSKWVRNYYLNKKSSDEFDYLKTYVRRSGIYEPHVNQQLKPFTLSTDEIATLFHLPSTAVTTPTLKRTDARKADPPGNLPTG